MLSISNLAKNVLKSQLKQCPANPLCSFESFGLTPKLCQTFSNRKSPQQQSYFKSRMNTYDSHKYPQFTPTTSIKNFLQKYSCLKQQTSSSSSSTGIPVAGVEQVVGRISSIRKHGKTTFIDIREQHVKLQVTVKTEAELQVKRGDVVGVRGVGFITKKGELSINCHTVQDFLLLAPCMWMIPEYEHLKDAQARFRNKPLDLLTNSQSVNMLIKRSKILSSLRNELTKQGYIQVQTPILSPSCGGAIAKPFVTYHNDHKTNLFLRIAPQLYLKKLLVGGLLKVFQIGKNFRNQSIDQTHNPQFTSCQLYCAYQDYRGMIDFTHKLLNKIAVQVNGSSIIKGKNSKGQSVQIDISGKWKEIDFMGGLEQALKMKLPIDFQNPQTIKFYDNLCLKNNIPCQQPRSIQRLLDKLSGFYLQTTHQPFLIMNHPRPLSPLAKPHRQHPYLTQRFQLFINGWQIVNSYTELNDPRIQRQNTPEDEDFVEALEYGLMPCAGWGIGLDRFIMLLTASVRIQEVIGFPLLREMMDGENLEKVDVLPNKQQQKRSDKNQKNQKK